MADTKISALPASTTPLAGTEVLPIVQSSTTRQVSVANLTAGRAISATQLTLTTGNLIVASGQGIDFSATSHPAGMTSELLDDYEEGTFTPTVSDGVTSPTYTTNTGTYTKIGNLVHCQIQIVLSGGTGSGAGLQLSGLPFASNATFRGGGYSTYVDATSLVINWYVPQGGNTITNAYQPGGAIVALVGSMASKNITLNLQYVV
jgi:hypothetical protein